MLSAIMQGIGNLLNVTRNVLTRVLRHHEERAMKRLRKHVKAARALLDYALAEGTDVDDRLIHDINQTEEALRNISPPATPQHISTAQRIAFEKAYRDLVKFLTPVTSESLKVSFNTIGRLLKIIIGLFILLLLLELIWTDLLPDYLSPGKIFLMGASLSALVWFLDLFTGTISKKRLIQIVLFCYLFTIISILSSMLLPTLLITRENIYQTMLSSPIGIVKGCSQQIKTEWVPVELQCLQSDETQNDTAIYQWVVNIGGWVVNVDSIPQSPSGQVPESQGASTPSASTVSQSAAPGGSTEQTTGDTDQKKGDYSTNVSQKKNPGLTVAKIRGGLVVPLYVVVIALMGGAVSMTRRVPEYQKRAYLPEDDVENKITMERARELLVFQIMQFISAPLIAVTAYYMVKPSDPTISAVLGFAAGFASETILRAISALVTKLTPAETITAGVAAKVPAPTISGLQPQQSAPTGSLHIALIGTGFQPDATVHMVRGADKIIADPVRIERSTKMTFDVNLPPGTPTGKWDVVITNPDNQTGIRPEGFEVT
jgi:hypothetical protein